MQDCLNENCKWYIQELLSEDWNIIPGELSNLEKGIRLLRTTGFLVSFIVLPSAWQSCMRTNKKKPQQLAYSPSTNPISIFAIYPQEITHISYIYIPEPLLFFLQQWNVSRLMTLNPQYYTDYTGTKQVTWQVHFLGEICQQQFSLHLACPYNIKLTWKKLQEECYRSMTSLCY